MQLIKFDFYICFPATAIKKEIQNSDTVSSNNVLSVHPKKLLNYQKDNRQTERCFPFFRIMIPA